MKDFYKKVSDCIRNRQLFCKEDGILVAVSGGPDSVALLRILLQLGYHCHAAHCNFHLRGEESLRDEKFVRSLCDELNVPLEVVHFDTAHEAATKKISIEMAARDLRYAYFEQLRKQLDLAVIAVAHHRDDNVETFLLNLMRGSGIHGLTGMHFKNGFVVRPLLNVDRTEILAYLNDLGQTFVTDSSNLQTQFTRNKIRWQLLPLMKQINPSIEKTLVETANRLHDTEAACREVIEEGKMRVTKPTPEGLLMTIDTAALTQEPAPEWLLYELLNPYGFSATQIDNILDGMRTHTGASFHAGTADLIIDRGFLKIRRAAQEEVQTFMLHSNTTLKWGSATLRNHITEATGMEHIPHEKRFATLDAEKIVFPLTVRHIQQGDRFMPFGMKHFKLVSDYLTDRKFSLFEKQAQIVVTSGQDIIWLVNERPDERFAVVAGKTRKILWMEFETDSPQNV